MRVAGRAGMGVFGGKTVGEFIHVQGRDRHGARGPQAFDDNRVTRGGQVVAQHDGPCRGDFAPDVKQVLHPEGHARQRAGIAARGNGFVHFLGLRHGGRAKDAGDTVEAGVTGFDIRNHVRRDRYGATTARAHIRRNGKGCPRLVPMNGHGTYS